MSGATGAGRLVLAETDLAAPRALPPGTDLVALYLQVQGEVERGLGPAHAAIFAQPVPGSGKVSWQAPGETARGLLELRAEDRRALLAAAGAILSEIRRLGESGRAPAVAASWPQLRSVPGPEGLFAVDGRPVLAPWGHATAPGVGDVLTGYDDLVPFDRPARTDWRPYAVALSGVAVLALLAGFGLPSLARWAIPAPAQCRADPSQLDLMRQQAEAESRGEALKGLLASLTDEIGRRELMCPLPTVQAEGPRPTPPVPTPTPSPTPSPTPTPPPHADLPQDRWNAHDLSMLEGCWHNTTRMTVRIIETGQVREAREWLLCFDHSGNGRQSLRFSGGGGCDGRLSASFAGEELVFEDRERCRGPAFFLMRGKMECERLNETEANCTRTDLEGPAVGARQTGRFMR